MKGPLNKAFFSKNSSLQVRRLFSKSGKKTLSSLKFEKKLSTRKTL